MVTLSTHIAWAAILRSYGKAAFRSFGFRSHTSASWANCGRLLSDLGARVIKVEPPDGTSRLLVPRVDGLSPYFTQYNAGKSAFRLICTLNMVGDIFLQLVPHADIVLENYRPGVMERLGIDFDRYRK